MTDDQFKELMKKLESIEREIKSGQWQHLFKPPLQPGYFPGYTPSPTPMPTPMWPWNGPTD